LTGSHPTAIRDSTIRNPTEPSGDRWAVFDSWHGGEPTRKKCQRSPKNLQNILNLRKTAKNKKYNANYLYNKTESKKFTKYFLNCKAKKLQNSKQNKKYNANYLYNKTDPKKFTFILNLFSKIFATKQNQKSLHLCKINT